MQTGRLKKFFLVSLCLFVFLSLLGGCSPNEEDDPNDEEPIEKVCAHVTNKRLFEEVIDGGRAATCSTAGYTLYRCKECGEEKRETISPTGNHYYVNNVCRNCGAVEPPVFSFREGSASADFYFGTGMLNELVLVNPDSPYWDDDAMRFTVQIGGSGEISAPADISIKVGSATKTVRWEDMRNNVTTVTVQGNNITLGKELFDGAENLSAIVVKEGLVGIGEGTFRNASSLQKADLPSGVTSVGKYAFEGCTDLESLSFPATVTYIGEGALAGCERLREITLPFVGTENRTGRYGVFCSLFSACEESEYAQSYTDGEKTYYYAMPADLSDINVTGGTIPPYAFADFRDRGTEETKISVWLSIEITEISDYAFYENGAMHSFAFCDFSAEIGTAEEGAAASKLTAIGKYAFYGCKLLNAFYLPKGVRVLSANAFQNCMAMTDFVFLQGNLERIESEAFYGCNGLKTLVLPKGLTEIGMRAFQGCSGVETLYLPAEITLVGTHAFYLCSGLTNVYADSTWVCNVQTNDTDLFLWNSQFCFWVQEDVTVGNLSYLRSKTGGENRYRCPSPDYRETYGDEKYILWIKK